MQLTLNALQTALDVAVAERKISFNPVRLVKRPKRVKPVHKLWTDAEEAAFFAFAAKDRLAAVLELFARGLRPEELCGIQWADIDLEGRTAQVGKHVRTMVEGKPIEKEAKTEAGIRTLPFDDELRHGLKKWSAVQAAEKLAAGEAYTDGDYLLADEVGGPWLPDKVRRYMYALLRPADVTRVTPYEAMRHAAGSRTARAGVPGHLIAAWLGHTDASFTYRNYVHARAEDLAEARDALSRSRSA